MQERSVPRHDYEIVDANGTVIAASVMTNTEKAIYLLVAFFVLDFITGILASWKEYLTQLLFQTTKATR